MYVFRSIVFRREEDEEIKGSEPMEWPVRNVRCDNLHMEKMGRRRVRSLPPNNGEKIAESMPGRATGRVAPTTGVIARHVAGHWSRTGT
jgi:hypothetical protein